jgi:hypothetical protein
MAQQTFTFLRTMRYTEVVTVEASSISDAKEVAAAADGERNHDDTVLSIEIQNA